MLIRIIVTSLVLFSALTEAIEEPKYTVLQEFENGIEIRAYEPHLVAVTKMDGSQNSGFRVLAGYIFGGNEKEQEIAMTAPVSTTMMADSPVNTIWRSYLSQMMSESTLEKCLHIRQRLYDSRAALIQRS